MEHLPSNFFYDAVRVVLITNVDDGTCKDHVHEVESAVDASPLRRSDLTHLTHSLCGDVLHRKKVCLSLGLVLRPRRVLFRWCRMSCTLSSVCNPRVLPHRFVGPLRLDDVGMYCGSIDGLLEVSDAL